MQSHSVVSSAFHSIIFIFMLHLLVLQNCLCHIRKIDRIVIGNYRDSCCRDDKLSQARTSVSDMQKRASQLYNALMEKRCNLTQKLNNGVHNVALLQNQLISDYLYDWKNRQKLQQVGVPFEERDHMIDEIQTE